MAMTTKVMSDLEKFRRVRLMARNIAKQIPPDEMGFHRASGDAICDKCGLILFLHPECRDGLLRVGCDGQQYKL
jgi:hypothetical protein